MAPRRCARQHTCKLQPQLQLQVQIRDSIMLVAGPDKGRTGRMIGEEAVAQRGAGAAAAAAARRAIIKLDTKLGGIREIKVVPYEMVAKTVSQPKAS
jgi:hypothetical protein